MLTDVLGAGERSPWEMCLLCKHENPEFRSLAPPSPPNRCGIMPETPSLVDGGPAVSLASQSSCEMKSRFSERLCLN